MIPVGAFFTFAALLLVPFGGLFSLLLHGAILRTLGGSNILTGIPQSFAPVLWIFNSPERECHAEFLEGQRMPLHGLGFVAILRWRCVRVGDIRYLHAKLAELHETEKFIGIVRDLLALIWVECRLIWADTMPAVALATGRHPKCCARFRIDRSVFVAGPPTAGRRSAGAVNGPGVLLTRLD